VICDHNEGSENSIILHHLNLIRNPNIPVVCILICHHLEDVGLILNHLLHCLNLSLWEKILICLLQDNRGDGTILLRRNLSQIFHPQGEARRMLRDQDHLIILNHHGSVQLRVVIHVHLWLKTFLHLEKLERIIWFSFFKGTAKNWSDYWSW